MESAKDKQRLFNLAMEKSSRFRDCLANYFSNNKLTANSFKHDEGNGGYYIDEKTADGETVLINYDCYGYPIKFLYYQTGYFGYGLNDKGELEIKFHGLHEEQYLSLWEGKNGEDKYQTLNEVIRYFPDEVYYSIMTTVIEDLSGEGTIEDDIRYAFGREELKSLIHDIEKEYCDNTGYECYIGDPKILEKLRGKDFIIELAESAGLTFTTYGNIECYIMKYSKCKYDDSDWTETYEIS